MAVQKILGISFSGIVSLMAIAKVNIKKLMGITVESGGGGVT